MTTCTNKSHFFVFLINLVQKQPIWFNMAIPDVFVISDKFVVFVFGRKWLFVDN